MAFDADARERVALASMSVIRERIAANVVDAALTTLNTAAADAGDALEDRASGRAAVAIVLRENVEGPQILLIRRAERAGDPWSGHMAFPGGREDARDGNLLATALRETREELALDLESTGRLLGTLSLLPAIARGRATGMVIAPFVFELTEDVVLAYKPDEVSEAVWVPLDPLMRGALRTTMTYELSGQSHQLPAYDFEGRIVWGLTYRMLDNLFELLR
jgi:8-oxo-dGTP pyrophosphatase MutT (NUDIX family)